MDGWVVLPSLPAKNLPPSSCDVELAAWLASDQTREYLRVTLPKRVFVRAEPHSATLTDRFLTQARKWDDETSHLSSPMQRMMHPSYQAILGMANENPSEMVFLLIKDMKENRREWFWALSYLTQENPIKPEDAGRMDKMIDEWVRWGKARHRP